MSEPDRPARGLAAAALAAAGALALALGVLAWQAIAPAPPQPVPPLVMVQPDGTPKALSDWRGKAVLVNFWATWCGPCLEEIPMLVAAQAQLGPRGLQVLGPALDSPEAVAAYVQQLGINYPVFPGDADVMAAMDALGDERGALPFTVLISPDGMIVQRKSGALSRRELDHWLAPYL